MFGGQLDIEAFRMNEMASYTLLPSPLVCRAALQFIDHQREREAQLNEIPSAPVPVHNESPGLLFKEPPVKRRKDRAPKPIVKPTYVVEPINPMQRAISRFGQHIKFA